MSFYQKLIIQTVKCSESDAYEIEEYMRHNIFNSTLDWQTMQQLEQGAVKAWKEIQFLHTSEGIAYINKLVVENNMRD
ncbi:hypothetical protein [Spirosoma panaciterrae]|uniref:hypothetical protein n=1 Tax=Spirosoma panaciterrae TaxID=496058 RepID=UPI00035DC8EB|nr:hypothetical protein [Spirosoma panaciterrae]